MIELAQPPLPAEVQGQPRRKEAQAQAALAPQGPEQARELPSAELVELLRRLVCQGPECWPADGWLALLGQAGQPAVPLPPRQRPGGVGAVPRLVAPRPRRAELPGRVLEEAPHGIVRRRPRVGGAQAHRRPHGDGELLRQEGLPAEARSAGADGRERRRSGGLEDGERPHPVGDVLRGPVLGLRSRGDAGSGPDEVLVAGADGA
mmetsp:Transcript_6740/g.15915  ORF Transcript_6740/g.15915 Transcript_6740/m.15915 type:complete len:205 (-) Transcript_6740:579-1193(-)